jgi:hypothetical protein
LDEVANRLANELHPEGIWLFSSHAWGTPDAGRPITSAVWRDWSRSRRWSLTLATRVSRWLLVATCICSPLAAQPAFDRVRITITSSSDWTTLRLVGPERVQVSQPSVVAGTATFGANSDSLSVFQSLSNAVAGQTVRVQFDVILQSTNPAQISCENTKGWLGVARIDFYSFNTDVPILVASVTNSVTNKDPILSFSVDAGSLLAGELAFTRPLVPPRILAFYYPWYSYDQWTIPYLRDEPPSPYSSDNPTTILQQVHQAKAAGIDGFISSWSGPGDYTDGNLQRLLAVAQDLDFWVTIYFESLTGNPPQVRPESEVKAWLRFFLQTYGNHPRLLRLEGKPAIFIYAAENAPTEMWGRVFDSLRGEGLDASYSACTLNANYLTVFDGLHVYWPLSLANLDGDFQEASAACRFYGVLTGEPQLKLWTATVQPGCDLRSLPGGSGTFIDRAQGRTYSRSFESALGSAPDWVLITSWNEWGENTHIEPSRSFGSLYLALTAQYADQFEGTRPRSPWNFQAPVVSTSDGALHLTWESPLAQTPAAYNLYRGTLPITNTATLRPLAAGLRATSYTDHPAAEGSYYYAVGGIFQGAEGPLSEVLRAFMSTNKAFAPRLKDIPADIAIYLDSTGWISPSEARYQANLLIQDVAPYVGKIEILNSVQLPQWVLSHIANGQVDVLLTFGDIPDSIYPSGNAEPHRSLAKAFVDDGNLIINTGDYMFFGNGRNGTGGLMNIMDEAVTMWGDNTAVHLTSAGTRFTPSLRDFITDRPFSLTGLGATDWQLEVSFADNGAGLADPAVVYNRRSGGRLGIAYQKSDDSLPRGQVISEIILNWLPSVLKVKLQALSKSDANFALAVSGGGGHHYLLQGSADAMNWLNLLQTNDVCPPFILVDTNATAAQRFYRVLAW